MPFSPRPHARTALLLLLGLVLAGQASAQTQASLAVVPSPVDLAPGPQSLSVDVYDAPVFTAFDLELRYPDESLRVTAVEAGTLVASPGERIEIVEVEPGRIRIAFEQSPEMAGDAEEGSSSAPASLPQGNGSLAVFTLAPIALAESALELEVGAVSLEGPEGTVELAPVRGQVLVTTEPTEEQRQAYLSQAEAMQASDAGGGPGLGETIRRAFRELGGRGQDLELGPQAMWLGLLLLGLGAVGLGWQFGRRPPREPETAEGERGRS